jgi:hypothetical protein
MKQHKLKRPKRSRPYDVIAELPTFTAAEIIKAPKITRMDTLWQCRKVLRAILKAMAKGDIPSQLGARLAYVSNLISVIVKHETEIKELTVLREKLAQLQTNAPALTYDAPNGADGAALNGAEYLPAGTDDEEPEA